MNEFEAEIKNSSISDKQKDVSLFILRLKPLFDTDKIMVSIGSGNWIHIKFLKHDYEYNYQREVSYSVKKGIEIVFEMKDLYGSYCETLKSYQDLALSVRNGNSLLKTGDMYVYL